MTENCLKQLHINMWQDIIEQLQKCNENEVLYTTIGNLKINYVKKLIDSLQSKSHNISDIDSTNDILSLTEKGICNNCFGCEFAENNCYRCPLLLKNGGRLMYECLEGGSTFACLSNSLRSGDWDKAAEFAAKIRDAWR